MRNGIGVEFGFTVRPMDNLVDLGIVMARGGGGVKLPLEAAFSRELTLGDLVAPSAEGATPGLKSIRETHHQLARLLASGLKAVEVSAITGFSQSRISTLQHDPAFTELLEFYRENENSRMADVSGQLAALSLDATQEIRDRLHDSPAGFKNRELMELATIMLDRTGFGPSSNVVNKNLNVNMTGEFLQELKNKITQGQRGNVVIEGVLGGKGEGTAGLSPA